MEWAFAERQRDLSSQFDVDLIQAASCIDE